VVIGAGPIGASRDRRSGLRRRGHRRDRFQRPRLRRGNGAAQAGPVRRRPGGVGGRVDVRRRRRCGVRGLWSCGHLPAQSPGYIATDNTQALQDDPEHSRSILERIPAVGRAPGHRRGRHLPRARRGTVHLEGNPAGWRRLARTMPALSRIENSDQASQAAKHHTYALQSNRASPASSIKSTRQGQLMVNIHGAVRSRRRSALAVAALLALTGCTSGGGTTSGWLTDATPR
jgi:hypothetical protein